MAGPAQGLSIITFGDVSPGRAYNTIANYNVDALDAYLGFSVTGGSLALTVTNPTGSGLLIQEVYFNVSSGINNLAVANNISAYPLNQLKFDTKGIQANGFGKFDVQIKDGGQRGIAAGQSYTYIMTINGGVGSFSESDFTGQYNSKGDMVAAIRFKETTGGATIDAAVVPLAVSVPEPGTILLLGSGLFGLAGLGRRVKP